MTAYGDKGCACWPDEDGAGRWMPNARCRFHGLLAGYTPPRTETGTYRVVAGACGRHPGASTISGVCAMCTRTPDAVLARRDLSTPPDGPKCPPGVHSIFDPCPGGCTLAYDDEEECTGCGVRQDYLGPCEDCEAKDADAALLARDDLQESLAQFRRGEILPLGPRPPWWQRAIVRAALWLWRDR